MCTRWRFKQEPEIHQVGPRFGGVSLRGPPRLLLIAGELEGRHKLRANETLVIVAGGIDQVAENFLLRPAAGRRTERGIGFGNVA